LVLAQIPFVASRHDTCTYIVSGEVLNSTHSRQARLVLRVVTCYVVCAASCLFQHGGRRRSSSACM